MSLGIFMKSRRLPQVLFFELCKSKRNLGTKEVENLLRLSKLENRALIEIDGPDSFAVLMNLTTNDVKAIKNRRGGQFTAFLNSRGRLICDVFLFNSQSVGSQYNDEFRPIIECDKDIANFLISHIKKYSFRSNLKLNILEGMTVYHLYGQGSSIDIIKNTDALVAMKDDRAPDLGVRIICKSDIERIPEGRKSIREGSALPSQCNIDLAGAISYSKGCYLGQELTVMTRSRGVVRRRLIPVQLYHINTPIPSSLSLDKNFKFPHTSEQIIVHKDSNITESLTKRPMNVLLTDGYCNIALALMGLEGLRNDSSAQQIINNTQWVISSDRNIGIKAFPPSWFPEEVFRA